MKNNSEIEKILRLLSDLEEFHPGDDYITQLIQEEKDAENELSEDALDRVAAARNEKTPPSSKKKNRSR